MTESPRHVRKLARRLAVNHVYLSSIRGLDQTGWKTIIPSFASADERETRVIAVVGAGASAPYGIPISKDACTLLQKRLDIDPTEFKEELDRLTSVYRLSGDDFETLLMAMGTTARRSKQLRDELWRMYAHSYPPVLTYEILAHLLKHRFIDAIINFNFDELLDQSIRDEIGSENYRYVLSDGHCLNLEPDRHGRYELPLYIKPHGTASHKSTLRFTREAYFGVPEEIRGLLADLVAGLPLTLILVGFGMQSFEFNHVLKASAADIDIFSFNIQDLNVGRRLESDIGRTFKWNHIQVGNAGRDLDSQFMCLWDAICKHFPKYFRPRTLCRHRLICDLFRTRIRPNARNNGGDKHEKLLPQYLRDRMVVEMALAIAKSKGLVDLTALADDRCGRYYEILRASSPDVQRLYDFFLRLGFCNVSYAGDVARQTRPNKDQDISEYPILTKSEFSKELPKLKNGVSALLRGPDVLRRFYGLRREFSLAMMELYSSEEVEISNKPDPAYPTRFRS